MPSAITYSLFLLADIAIIGFIIHFGYCTLTVDGSIALKRSARRRQFATRFDKLNEGSHYVAVFLSFGLALWRTNLSLIVDAIPMGFSRRKPNVGCCDPRRDRSVYRIGSVDGRLVKNAG